MSVKKPSQYLIDQYEMKKAKIKHHLTQLFKDAVFPCIVEDSGKKLNEAEIKIYKEILKEWSDDDDTHEFKLIKSAKQSQSCNHGSFICRWCLEIYEVIISERQVPFAHVVEPDDT